MTNMVYVGELVITSCWCGVRLAIPDSLNRQAQSQSGMVIFCPLGHKFTYRESDADRQRKRAEEAEQLLRFARAARDAALDQADAAHRSAAAYKGHLTRIRNKIANGVCPVEGCRRHFDNVQAHIVGQHPGWAAEHPEALA